jgi:protein TonB
LNFKHYIVISILSHLLFIGFLVLTPSTTGTKTSIFDINIVGPLEIQKPPVPKKIKPAIKKRKPIIVKRRRRPPEKNVLPETLYGDDTELSSKESVNSTGTEHSDELKEQDSSPEKNGILSSQPQENNGLSSGKDNPSLVPRSQLFDKKTIEKFARKSQPTKKGLTFDTSEFKHRGYMRMLKEKIENIWKYPKEAARLGISGDLYVKFSIKRDGKLDEVELLRTSGYRDLDEAAMKAVKDAEPYWPLPDDWTKDVLEIKGHFIYIHGRTYAL